MKKELMELRLAEVMEYLEKEMLYIDKETDNGEYRFNKIEAVHKQLSEVYNDFTNLDIFKN